MGLTPCGMLLPTLVRNLEPSQGGPMPAKTPQQQPDNLRNPYGYSEMDWAAQLDPAYAAARAEVRRLSVGEDGALSVKVKEFVVLGVLASRGLQYGGGGAHAPRPRARGDQGRVIRGHQSGGRPRGRGRL